MALGQGGTDAALGTLPNFLQPTQGKNLYAGNYLDFFNLANGASQWAQQFLPDVYDKEVEIYGNRTISGFLKMVSAEMPSTSDQIIWLEQGRLHTRYVGVGIPTAAAAAGATVRLTASTTDDQLPGGSLTITTEGASNSIFNFRVGQMVMIQEEDGSTATFKGIVSAVAANGGTADIDLYTAKPETVGAVTVLVYGSEFAKGSGNFTEKLDPSYTTYTNSPIIMKEHYAINGSDTGQIGWIEVTSENGASGYLWYVKAEHENRLRWEDYIEMAMVEGVEAPAGITLNSFRAGGMGTDNGATNQTLTANGTEGFFAALQSRGNIYEDLAGDIIQDRAGNGTGATANRTHGLTAFDSILMQLDKQGAIEENMLYVDRALSLAFTDMLAAVNSTGNATGTSYGVFNNSEDMALKLHFSGFRRGSYDFYQTDWKYLNDFSTRGGFSDIQGVMIPAGTSTVYDQNLGKNIKRPFLHVRYRASETDNRKKYQ